MCTGELSAVIAHLMSKRLWSMGGSGCEELKKCPPHSPAVLWFNDGCERWFMNLCERKPDRRKYWNIFLQIKKLIAQGWNKAQSLDMTEHICHLISHKFSQFQSLPSHFVNKKLKISYFISLLVYLLVYFISLFIT